MRTLYFCPVVSFYLSFFYSSPNLSGCRLDVYHTSFRTWCGLSANLECRSEMCCTRLAGNTGHKNDSKNRHLGTITQLCRAISSKLGHVSTIWKKNLLSSNISPTCLQYGELRPTSGWDRFVSLGHPSKFQRVSCLGSVTAQPNCGVEQRAPPVFGRAAITLGIGPHF